MRISKIMCDGCKYAGAKDNQCDYIGKTGKMRGCDPEACIKYERR